MDFKPLKPIALICLIIFCVSVVILIGCNSDYEVKLKANPAGAGQVTGEGSYKAGETVEVIAEAKEGYVFKKWTENGEKISDDEKYQFTIDDNVNLIAEFSAVETGVKTRTKIVDNWTISETIIDENKLNPVVKKEGWYSNEGNYSIADIGDNYLAKYSYSTETVKFMKKDSLEVVDKMEQVLVRGLRSIEFLGEDHFLFKSRNNEKSYIYKINDEGISIVKELDLWKSGLTKIDEDERLSQMLSQEFIYITPKHSNVGEYLFIYADYYGMFQVEEPPRLNEPFLKVFKFENGELIKLANDLLEESLLTTDIIKYNDKKAILATGCEGFIQINLDDFSLEKLNIGGKYNLAKENRPFSGSEQYENHYIAHSFRGVSSEGAILVRTQIPLPKCHGWVKQLWAPTNDGSFTIVAQSDVYSKGQIGSNDDLLGEFFPHTLHDDRWVSMYRSQTDVEGFEGGGVFALLKLDNEKVLQDAQTSLDNELPEISQYLDMEVDLKHLLKNAGITNLPYFISWEANDGQKFSSNENPITLSGEEKFIFGRITENQIDITQVNGDINLIGVDEAKEQVYLQVKQDLYIVRL
ncbi:hypothetical protein SYNTR_0229 [Candidatus Syntrophocurvum alkaliphilum]|uniref:Bacterial repeat domain-containing protein n=1 Tax=Candidatus Syntrophocurvum alkaliphilum TaxID=2293317 RepID=A0A6I6DDC1_9FIRM|nr:hypothetical protein [Candidatus Syntrophocurvum alkaliphilum]QGT98822.1 hypothetical protein SYNTR_0229 [Candidatus Syntrophocurvum alkaliphilum]